MPGLDFWFDFASPYSYLTAMRIEHAAGAHGVDVRWRPFLLGPIFKMQGLGDSPFNLHPAKGRYMWRDMERRAGDYGIGFRRPDEASAFPRNSVLAACTALAALDEPWGKEFCRSVFRAEFIDWLDISGPDVIGGCLDEARGAVGGLEACGTQDSQRSRLRNNVEEAVALGIFGAPSLVAGKEVFWGDDRLEQAIDWVLARG